MRAVLLRGKQRISRAKYWVSEHQGAYKYATLLSYEGRREVICFCHLNCLCTTKSTLLGTFSPVEAISLEIWDINGPNIQNVHFRFPSVSLKGRFPMSKFRFLVMDHSRGFLTIFCLNFLKS